MKQVSPLPKRERIFYTGLAAVFVLTVFIGFSRSYYVKGLFASPGLSLLAHIHGAVFSLWVVFFFGQTALVAAGRTDLHRRAGLAGAGLALGVVVLGTMLTIVSVRSGHASGRPEMALLLVNALVDLMLFCLFFGAGFYFRRKKEVHKRLMTLSMVAIIIPALTRLPSAMSYIGLLILGFSVVGILYDAILLRRVTLANVVGGAVILLSTPLRFMIAPTPQWQSFFHWVVR